METLPLVRSFSAVLVLGAKFGGVSCTARRALSAPASAFHPSTPLTNANKNIDTSPRSSSRHVPAVLTQPHADPRQDGTELLTKLPLRVQPTGETYLRQRP